MQTTDVRASVHDDGPRRATSYPVTLPHFDPEVVGHDLTTSWPVIMLTLVLVPPLGALQLTHRVDVPVRLRIAISLLSVVVVAMTWASGLRLLPLA
jgi:hypothetical protein